MKVVKWILIVLALAAVIFITIPSDILCSHDFEYHDGCTKKVCTKCGKVTNLSSPSHRYQVISCSERKCTVCEKTFQGNYHQYQNIPCTNEQKCSVCEDIKKADKISHNRTTTYDGCTTNYVCADCGILLGSTDYHKWVSDNCEEGCYCKYCGVTAPDRMGHNYSSISSAFDLPMVCTSCGDWRFQELTFGAACVYLGLLMCVAAFIFIFINRKRIRIREGKYLWTVTPDAHLRPIRTDEEHL